MAPLYFNDVLHHCDHTHDSAGGTERDGSIVFHTASGALPRLANFGVLAGPFVVFNFPVNIFILALGFRLIAKNPQESLSTPQGFLFCSRLGFVTAGHNKRPPQRDGTQISQMLTVDQKHRNLN